jgi:hypothetical protein
MCSFIQKLSNRDTAIHNLVNVVHIGTKRIRCRHLSRATVEKKSAPFQMVLQKKTCEKNNS